MNTDKPHDIVDHQAYSRMPAARRDRYTSITAAEAEYLADKSEDEREAWLRKTFQQRLADMLRSRP